MPQFKPLDYKFIIRCSNAIANQRPRNKWLFALTFTELLAAEMKAQALMIEKLQHQLHGANRHRFGSKSESMDQLQLFAENEEIAQATTETKQSPPAEPVEPKGKPKRKPLAGFGDHASPPAPNHAQSSG